LKSDWLRLFVLFVVVQVAWFAVVLSAARGSIWIGPAIAAALLLAASFQLPSSARVRWLLAALLLGLAGAAGDSILAAAGLVRFAAGYWPWLAPPWIVALWSLSALWLPRLSALSRQPMIAAVLGAIGGPAAYAGGVRLGAATFRSPSWPSLLALAIEWGIALPLMLRVPALVAPDSPPPPGLRAFS